MEFWKMNGAGNDFIVVDDRRNAIPENRWLEIVRVLCERHMSIGADGTEQMEPVQGKVLLTENDKITAIADASVSLDGYEVIDLGKDVPKEKIIEATIEHNAQIIALSALMTTTMQEMRNVVEYAKEKGVTAKIMIGGAVITQDYADEIHADGYSRDAADAVRLAKRLVGMQE